MKVSSIPLLTLLFCIPMTGIAQTRQTGTLKFSLSEAKDYALVNSPVLLNSERDVEIAKKMIWENTASGLPQADLSASYAYSPKLAGLTEIFTGGSGDTTGGSNPFGFEINPNDLKTSFYMDIRVTQLVFSGQYLVGLKAAKVYASLSSLAHSKSKMDIIESITNTYYLSLIVRQTKDVLDSTLDAVQKTLHESNEMFKNGFVEQTDVDQLKILESNIKSSLSVNIRQIELTERLLKFQMGISVDQPIELTDKLDPLVNMMNLQAAVIDSFRMEDNVDYKMLDSQEKLMKLNMQVTMAKFLPTIGAFYNRHQDYDNNFFNDQSPNMFGLSLSFPLWSSGMRISQVGQRKLDYLKAKTDKQMVQESLLIQYETALSVFLSARDIFNMQKENRDLALRIYKKAITKFKVGVGSSLDLNQTQTQYFNAESSYFNALMSLVNAKSTLESLTTKTEN